MCRACSDLLPKGRRCENSKSNSSTSRVRRENNNALRRELASAVSREYGSAMGKQVLKASPADMPVIADALGRCPDSFDNEMPGTGANLIHVDRSSGEAIAKAMSKAKADQDAKQAKVDAEERAAAEAAEAAAEAECREEARRIAEENTDLNELAESLQMSPEDLAAARLVNEHDRKTEDESFAEQIGEIEAARDRSEQLAESAYERGRDRVAARHEATLVQLDEREGELRSAHAARVDELDADASRLAGDATTETGAAEQGDTSEVGDEIDRMVAEARAETDRIITDTSQPALDEVKAALDAREEADPRDLSIGDRRRLEEAARVAVESAAALDEAATDAHAKGDPERGEALREAAVTARRESARAIDAADYRYNRADVAAGDTYLDMPEGETPTSFDYEQQWERVHAAANEDLRTAGDKDLSQRADTPEGYAAAGERAAQEMEDRRDSIQSVISMGVLVGEDDAAKALGWDSDSLSAEAERVRDAATRLTRKGVSHDSREYMEGISAIPHAYLDQAAADGATAGGRVYDFGDQFTEVPSDPRNDSTMASERGKMIDDCFEDLDHNLAAFADDPNFASFATSARAKYIQLARQVADDPKADVEELDRFVASIGDIESIDEDKFFHREIAGQESLFDA